MQKINHFPGMTEICRKDLLSRNLNKMIKLFPKDYNVFPKSWVLPAEWVHLSLYVEFVWFEQLEGNPLKFCILISFLSFQCFILNYKAVIVFIFISYGDFLSFSRQKKNKTYILKPASGCQGKGIWITRNVKDIKPHEHMVCQQYLSRVCSRYWCMTFDNLCWWWQMVSVNVSWCQWVTVGVG